MVWRDAWFAVTTCPVRTLTPEVKDVLAWFDRTHGLQIGFGAVTWQLQRLPGSGGVGEQDARLMAALEWTRDLKNALLQDTPERRRRKDSDKESRDRSDSASDKGRKRVKGG